MNEASGARPKRRARVLAWIASVLLLAVGAIYLAAWLGKDYSTAARALIWMDGDDCVELISALALAANGPGIAQR